MQKFSVKRLDSSAVSVSKYVFDFGDAVAESVLYGYPDYGTRTVICCSTQSGCPIGCRFCGAGDAFVRSLTGDEIVAQVQYLMEDRNITSDAVQSGQIMFMSMGEPMLNFCGLDYAIRKLSVLYPMFALLVSTSAPRVDYERLRALSVEVPAVGLQFSVHESTDEGRNSLIPFKDKLDLYQISREGEKWFAATGRQPFFNYCAHNGNTSHEDAFRIYNLFNPAVWQATISVVCERDESVAAANDRQRKLATNFMGKLKHYGYSTRCFDPSGQDDIGGGCGQLWFVQDWMRRNSALARKSIGAGFPAIHAPR